MADITNEIAAIQVATTGSAIRSALIDALEAINTDQSWTADDVPTQNSNNLVKSGGIYSAIQEIKKKVIVGTINNGVFTAYTIGAYPSTSLTIQCTITETT